MMRSKVTGAQRWVVALADIPVLPEQAEGRVAVGVDGQDLPVELPDDLQVHLVGPG